MKKISILVPTYNEEENIAPLSREIIKVLDGRLPEYDYELVFIDNDSADRSRDIIRGLCTENPKVKAIFNARNFGQFNSPFYGLLHVTGDCAILMCADFQDPVDMIPRFVTEWENGYRIVCGIKTSSRENRMVYALRTMYYRAIKKMSDVEQIEHFTGFALYDRSFIEVLKGLDDPRPFLRGLVAELGYRRKDIEYEQPRRRAGKTKNNWYSLYDAAMLSLTSYTKIGMRIAIFAGAMMSAVSMLVALIYLILKLIYWDRFIAGQAPMVIVTCVMCSVLLFFVGLLGEYVLNINSRVIKRPLVIEEERINFGGE